MIYRVHYRNTSGESKGYEYYPSLAAMDKNVKDYPHTADTFCCKINTPRTKKEMIQVLNQFGGHPDNG